MENLNLRAKKFSPFPSEVEGRWAGVFEDEGFFAVLEIASSESFDFALAARIVWETLGRVRKTDRGGTLEILEKAAMEARERVGKFFPADAEGGVNFSFLTLKDDLLYLSSVGKIAPYILREERPLYLGNKRELWAKSVLLEPQDRFVILTPSLSQALSPSLFRTETPWEGPAGRRKAEIPGAAGLVLDFFETRIEEEKAFPFEWGEKISRLLSKVRFARKKPLYVRETPAPRLRERRSIPSALILFLGAVFLGSIIFTLVKERQRVRGQEAVQHLEKAEEELKGARDLLGLDSERVAENLSRAREDLSKAKVLGLSKKRAESLEKEIEEIEAKVLKIYPVSSKLLYDLGVQGREAAAQDLAVGEGGNILVLDHGQGVAFKIVLPQEGEGRPKVEKFLPNLSSPLGLDSADDVVLIREDSSVSVFSSEGALLGRLELEGFWEIEDAKIYGGNVYLLSAGDNQVLKASPGAGGYSSFSPWLKEALEIDKSSRMALDGYIYVWSGGMLRQFAGGRETGFSLRGKLKNPIQNPKDIVTWREAKNIYILDANLSRVLKFSKDGALLGQFTDSQWGEPQALAISPDEKRGFVLSGNRIFEFDF